MTVRFLQFGDTHLGPSVDATFPNRPDIVPYQRAKATIEWMNQIPAPVDFVIHTGDVSHFGQLPEDSGEATRLGASLFRSLKYPLHVAVGNHDNRRELGLAFPLNGMELIPTNQERRAYWFTVNEEDFVVLDARDSRDIDPQGRLCEDQLAFLESFVARSSNHPITVFVHYAPLPLLSEWIDRTMLILNGEEMHRILVNAKRTVRGVFHGHVHRGMQHVRDGILYSSVGGTVMQFEGWPELDHAKIETTPTLFVNYIQISNSDVIVQQLTKAIED